MSSPVRGKGFRNLRISGSNNRLKGKRGRKVVLKIPERSPRYSNVRESEINM